LLPPLDDPPEVRAVWSIGSMTSQLLEGRALESSLPNANDFMERARAADLAELVKLRSGTEKQALLELAQQVYFVLAGLVRRQTRASLTWVRVAYEIRPQRHTLVVRTWNPFTRFTEALKEIETSRLRRCAVCDQFFYAIREDAKCCSRKCSQRRRQHRYAGNWERYRRARKFRTRTGLAAVKGKERRRLMELSEALRATKPEKHAGP